MILKHDTKTWYKWHDTKNMKFVLKYAIFALWGNETF